MAFNHQTPRNKTLIIGAREITLIVTAVAMLSLAVFIFMLGIGRLQHRNADAAALMTATSSLLEAPTAISSYGSQTETPVLAPTMAPTAATAEHIVQSGESLTSIAILYGVDLEALLAANNLTTDSVIQAGQKLIVPLIPGNEGTYHDVQPGEALANIAERYGVSIEAIQRANNLADVNAVYAGQRLYIPGAPQGTPTPDPAVPTPIPSPTSQVVAELMANGPLASDWDRSILEGDLDTNYPLLYDHDRFRLHYQPDTYPAQHLDETVSLAADGLARAESVLNVQLDGKFDIYVAGTLFDYPNAALRGLSLSRERRVFILHDGSGTPVDNAYFFANEITHLVAWNTWGQPSTTMLSEGLATYAGQSILEDGGYLPYDQLCLAIYAAGQMPSMAAINTDFRAFKGHIRDPFNYFGSACFVKNLLDQYGLEPLSGLYHTSDYTNLYGTSLVSLDADWLGSLEARQPELTLDAQALADHEMRVSQAYAYVFGNYNGSEAIHLSYAAADRARVALWRGEFEEVDRWLAEFTALSGFTP